MQYRELTRSHPLFLGVERMVAVKQVGGRSALRPRERGARHSRRLLCVGTPLPLIRKRESFLDVNKRIRGESRELRHRAPLL